MTQEPFFADIAAIGHALDLLALSVKTGPQRDTHRKALDALTRIGGSADRLQSCPGTATGTMDDASIIAHALGYLMEAVRNEPDWHEGIRARMAERCQKQFDDALAALLRLSHLDADDLPLPAGNRCETCRFWSRTVVPGTDEALCFAEDGPNRGAFMPADDSCPSWAVCGRDAGNEPADPAARDGGVQ